MPRFFQEVALLQDSVSGIRTRKPHAKNATSNCGTLLESTFDPGTRGGRVQALSRPSQNPGQISFAPPSLYPFLPPSNQAVAGMNWRQEAPADFRATLMPPSDYKIRS
ncbi:hypothetical protein PoB_007200600 [Plakobranchus ocellatus]|uniref:Uncharacterized protein n=1 Tax=Plakobranchus ocellatus TaxID=259542 RepID=A0AAV4DMY4_9GAST|nr:hypothetical protein PoB_007200600 [Plakobranchus ocellatus]